MEGGGKEVRGQRLKETRKGRPLSPSHLSLSPSHLSLSHTLSLSPSLPLCPLSTPGPSLRASRAG
jgi:hypothetical protein